MKTVSLCGYYGHSNYGDSLMLKGLESFLRSNNFGVVAHSDRQSSESLNFKSFSPTNVDIIAIGGGGIVTESFWFIKNKLYEKINNKKLILLNVGLTSEAGPVLEKIQDQIDLAVVRDRFSENLISHHIPKEKIVYAPDISLLNKIEINESKENAIGVCLNYFIYKDFFSLDQRKRTYAEKALIEIASFLNWAKQNCLINEIYLVPCQIDKNANDNIIHGILNGFLEKKANWVYSNREIEKILNRCKLIISSRYHSSLFALKTNTPFIDITHHSKNSNFLDDCGLSNNSINYWHLELNALVEKFKKVQEDKDFSVKSREFGVVISECWNRVSEKLKEFQ